MFLLVLGGCWVGGVVGGSSVLFCVVAGCVLAVFFLLCLSFCLFAAETARDAQKKSRLSAAETISGNLQSICLSQSS